MRKRCRGEAGARRDAFLADVFRACDECDGKTLQPKVLGEVQYRGRSIVRCSTSRFHHQPGAGVSSAAHRKCGACRCSADRTAIFAGIGPRRRCRAAGAACIRSRAHLRVSAWGGERCLRLVEPTTGLHFDDIAKLLSAFRKLLEAGSALLVIRHNLDVIKTADYIIDLGPNGGEEGGPYRRDGDARADCPEQGVSYRALHQGGPLAGHNTYSQRGREEQREGRGRGIVALQRWWWQQH